MGGCYISGMGPIFLRRAALCGLLLSVGCASGFGAPEPAERRLTWLAYLSGADIRAVCAAGRPDRFRLIHRDERTERLLAFEIVADGPRGAFVEAHAFPATDPSRLDLSAPVGPWETTPTLTRLGPAQYRQLVERLVASGAFTDPPPQPPATADGWLISGCLAGTWFIQPYVAPHRRRIDVDLP